MRNGDAGSPSLLDRLSVGRGEVHPAISHGRWVRHELAAHHNRVALDDGLRRVEHAILPGDCEADGIAALGTSPPPT